MFQHKMDNTNQIIALIMLITHHLILNEFCELPSNFASTNKVI